MAQGYKEVAGRALQRHYTGCYRLSGLTLGMPEYFAQITRRNNEWHAEWRVTETGNLVRFDGIWPTLRDAVEEVSSRKLL